MSDSTTKLNREERVAKVITEMSRLVGEVQGEMMVAVTEHGGFHSAHEGYAVLLEEVEELWAEIKINPKNRTGKPSMLRPSKWRLWPLR